MADFFKACTIGEIPAGTGKAVEVNGRKIALFNVDGTLHALHGVCPHQGGPLGEGILEGQVVTCPWHFWQFDVVRGHAPGLPEARLPKYRVKLEGDDILVEV